MLERISCWNIMLDYVLSQKKNIYKKKMPGRLHTHGHLENTNSKKFGVGLLVAWNTPRVRFRACVPGCWTRRPYLGGSFFILPRNNFNSPHRNHLLLYQSNIINTCICTYKLTSRWHTPFLDDQLSTPSIHGSAARSIFMIVHLKDVFQERRGPEGMSLPVCLMPRLQPCRHWTEDLHSWKQANHQTAQDSTTLSHHCQT
jgi:hypothetical protein